MSNVPRRFPSTKITAITVTGFKSAIEPVRVNVREITIFAGTNSAGKSSMMQPLLIMKQTIEKQYDPGGLAIEGPLACFTSASQFFSHISGRNVDDTFSVGFEQGPHNTTVYYKKKSRTDDKKIVDYNIDSEKMTFGSKNIEYTWTAGDKLKENDESVNYILNELQPFRGMSKGVFAQMFRSFDLRVLANRSFLTADFVSKGDTSNRSLGRGFMSPANSLTDQIRNLIYLPGLRGNPERSYTISAAGPQFPGNFNDYVASIIHHWVLQKDDRLKQLEKDLKSLGLTWRVTAKKIADTRVEIHVGRLPNAAQGGARDTVNIADVGFGVSQTLPVLVALLSAAKEQIVFVEQPELHLHPRAQVALSEIILRASQRGVRVIVETHSSLLILALQALVAEGQISPAKVSMNWFTRDGTGQTRVQEAELGNDGSYGNWPVDFDDVELGLQDRYLNSVDRLRAKSSQ